LSDALNVDESEGPHLGGSGRSIPAFHLLEALESMSHLFRKFGGHRQAAGLTLPAHHLEEFQHGFHTFAATKLTPDDLCPTYSVDAHISLRELTEDCVQQIFSLGPFGFGNSQPTFCANGVEVCDVPRVLKEDKHFAVSLKQDGRILRAKAWNFGHRQDLLQPGTKLDVLFHVEDDPYSRKRGYPGWCLSLKDIRLAERLPTD
jgi:single-stranded-DNA-specific exonuclease